MPSRTRTELACLEAAHADRREATRVGDVIEHTRETTAWVSRGAVGVVTMCSPTGNVAAYWVENTQTPSGYPEGPWYVSRWRKIDPDTLSDELKLKIVKIKLEMAL